MGLFTPGWNNADKLKALQWVARQPGNSRKLVEAARFAQDGEVREAALNAITDQNLLISVTYSDAPDSFKKRAVLRVTNQALLEEAIRDYNEYAILAVTDPNLLSRVAYPFPGFYNQSFNASPGEYMLDRIKEQKIEQNNCAIAIERIKEPDDLLWLARSAVMSADNAAARLIELCPEKAADIARNERCLPGARGAAFDAIKDPALLEELYWGEKDALLRARLLERLSDQGFLTEVAERDEDADLRVKAASRITDPEKRLEFCRTLGSHDWEYVDETRSDCGDVVYIYDNYRCKYCGETKAEVETWRR